MRNAATLSEIDILKSKKNETDLSLSMDARLPGPTMEQRPPFLSSKSLPSPSAMCMNLQLELEDIKEDTDETGQEIELLGGLGMHSSLHCSVPDIRITFDDDDDVETVGRYRKISDPGSPPPD